MPDVFMEWTRKQPNKACLIDATRNSTWTFQDVCCFNFKLEMNIDNILFFYFYTLKLENYGNKIANLFHERLKLQKGDCVALFMENRPEFVGIWYGLGKLGVITALINTNLKSKALVYSIEIAKPKCVIYDEELEQRKA